MLDACKLVTMVLFKGIILTLLAIVASSPLIAQNVATSLAATAPAAAPALPPSAEATIPIPLTEPPKVGSPQSVRDEISRLTLEKEKIAAALALSQTKLDQELAEARANASRLQAELAEKKARQELADFEAKQKFDTEVADL